MMVVLHERHGHPRLGGDRRERSGIEAAPQRDRAYRVGDLQTQRGHPIKTPPIPEFSDEQLQAINAPTRVLVDRINERVPPRP
jgi:hypothetical protein